jgi:hypothetical protein
MKLLLKIFFIFVFVQIINAQPITWQKTYSYGNIEYGYSIVQTEDEGYIAVGRRRINSTSYLFAMRLNKFGDTLWTRTYTGFRCLQIEKCSDSNFIISSLNFGSETSLFKIDINGNILWRKFNVGTVFKISTDSFIYVCRDIKNVSKYDLNGDSIWNKYVGTNISLKAIFIQTNDEIILLASITDSTFSTQSILKINSSGELTDTVKFTASFNPGYFILNMDNSFVVAGIIQYKVRLSKYDKFGSLSWERVYDSISPDYADCNYLIKTSDEGYAITGTYDTGNFNFLMRLIKTDSNGIEQFRNLYGFNDNDQPFCLRQATDSGFVLIGIRDNFDLGDIYIVKTDMFGYAAPPVSVNSLSENISDNYILFQNYPNPFNPQTTINFYLPQKDFVEIKIYNSQGLLVKLVVNKLFAEGNYEMKFDGSNLNSGIYFAQLKTKNYIKSIKMLLIK